MNQLLEQSFQNKFSKREDMNKLMTYMNVNGLRRWPELEDKLLEEYKEERISINFLSTYWNYSTFEKGGRWKKLEKMLFKFDRLKYLLEVAKCRVKKIEARVSSDEGDYPYLDETERTYLDMFVNETGFFSGKFCDEESEDDQPISDDDQDEEEYDEDDIDL
jgi:hypothetical protein